MTQVDRPRSSGWVGVVKGVIFGDMGSWGVWVWFSGYWGLSHEMRGLG